MSLLNIENLSFSYQENTPILNNLSFTLDTAPTAIIGQNGAGKTTLVKLIKGLLTPTHGNIYINDEIISGKDPAEIAKDIGMVFQNPNDQIFKNKIIDEVMFGPLQIGFSKDKALEFSNQALEKVGLLSLREKNPYDLGLHEQKLIAIASVLAMQTKIIIFDEPTIAQDETGKSFIQDIIKELARQGKLVICIVHDMDFVANCMQRTIVMLKGEIVLDGNTSDVFQQEEILKKAHLCFPYVSQLSKNLHHRPLSITEQEFIKMYRESFYEK